MGILVIDSTAGLGRIVVPDPAAHRIDLGVNGGTSEEDVDRLFDEALDLLTDGLDAVVTVSAGRDEVAIAEMTLSGWNDTLNRLLRLPFLVTRRALQEFLAGDGGCLVHVLVHPQRGAGAETAGAALRTLTRSVSKEYGGRQVRCNGVEVASASAPDVAAAADLVTFLMSPAASFVTGDIIPAQAAPAR